VTQGGHTDSAKKYAPKGMQMRSADWKDIAELVGIAAIIASLVFVGLQMKQTHQIALSSAYQARSAISIEMYVAAATSPQLMTGMAKVVRGKYEELSEEEYQSLSYFFGAEMFVYENNHYQSESGFLPYEHWSKNVSEINCYLSHPFYRTLVRDWDFRKSFQNIIDEILENPTAELSDCWLAPPTSN
jgi:hypothetical protein